jgi:soluble lytic murein transglycosylase-like protein
VVLAAATTLALAVLSAAAARFDGWAGGSSAVPAPAAKVAALPPAVAAPARPVHAAGPREQIEALAGLVARKYRVSPKVARDLIGTAYREGARFGVDPLLVVAVIAVESRFNPIAQSDAGAMGLMQVIPGFHEDKFDTTVADPVLDPHANIRLGARVLREYIVRAGGEAAGLQMYNGAADDPSNAYANRVFAERARLQQAVARPRERTRA